MSIVVASGSVLHALYADSLGLTPDDLGVSGIWQATSAVKLSSLLSYALFGPALWGIAKQVDAPFVSPVERLGVPLYVLTQVTVVAMCALDSAGEAVKDFRTAAIRKTDPPSYLGVTPEWTCIEPTVPAVKLGSRGGVLRPERPYLSFGAAGETVSLWEEMAGTALQMPAEQVSLVPAANGRVRRSFPYASCRRTADPYQPGEHSSGSKNEIRGCFALPTSRGRSRGPLLGLAPARLAGVGRSLSLPHPYPRVAATPELCADGGSSSWEVPGAGQPMLDQLATGGHGCMMSVEHTVRAMT
ncbi:hypothetical protein OHU45_09040 [Streptomyces tubercidicus]|uniref:hypothetical protein n=1 Tax=Streptomyces tubercidicus TaxID=47759 RepID=UPI0030E55400